MSSAMREEIRLVFERCRQRYPTVRLSIEEFGDRIEEISASLPAGAGSIDQPASGGTFSRLHHEDLFLALACSRGDRIAWEHFADDYLPALNRYAAQACRQLAESEDLAQDIIAMLLEDRRRLAGYNGLGSLAGWLRVSVAHAAIDRFRRAKRQVSLDELEENGPTLAASEGASARHESLEPLDARWGPVLLSVLSEEIRQLPARDRLLLGLYYQHEVSLKSIGRQFGVHEATASRWLERLRRGLRKQIERKMKRCHGLGSGDLESVWRWISEAGGFSLREAISGCKNGEPERPMKGAYHG